MGFSFRKSKNLGGFKVNLSKSGIGISTGVKGFRVSAGPKGVNLNAGRNGLYYRKKLSSSADDSSFAENEEHEEYETLHPKNGSCMLSINDKIYSNDWISNFEEFVQSPMSYCHKVMGIPYYTPKEFELPSLMIWFVIASFVLFIQFFVGLLLFVLLFYCLIKIKKSDKAIASELYKKALDFYRISDYQSALDCYEEISKNFKIEKIEKAKTACYIGLKDYKNAYKHSCNYWSEDKICTAELMFISQSYEDLINHFQTFKPQLNENIEVITLCGLTYYKLENYEKALEVLSLGPTRKRTNIDYFLAQYFYVLGKTYEQMQQDKKAIAQFKKVSLYNENFADIKQKIPTEEEKETETKKQVLDDFNYIRTFDSYFISCDKYRKKDGNVERGDCQILFTGEYFLIKQDTEIIKNKVSSIYYFDIWEYEERTYFKFRMRSLTEYIFGATEFEADEIANYLKTCSIKIEDNRE